MGDGNSSGNVNIQINTSANTQGADNAAGSLKRVEAATASAGEQAKVASEKGQKLNLAMEGLARISPTAAAAVNMLKMAMNPMAAAIALGAAAIYGLQKAYEGWHRVINTSELSKIPNLWERMAEAHKVAEDSSASLTAKLQDLQVATEREKTSFEGMIGALGDYSRHADAVLQKRKEIASAQVDRDVASGRIKPEEGARRKAAIDVEFTKESGAAREKAVRGEIILTEEGRDKAAKEKAEATAAADRERQKLAGMVSPEEAAASLAGRKAELAKTVARMATVQGTINKDLGGVFGVTNPANYRELEELNRLSDSMIGEIRQLENPKIRTDYRNQQTLVGRLDKQAEGAGAREAAFTGKLPALNRQLGFVRELNGLNVQAAGITAAGVTEGANRSEDSRAHGIVRSAFNAAGGGGTKSQMVSMDEKMVSLLVELLRPILNGRENDRAQIQKIENIVNKAVFQMNAGRGNR